MRRIYSILIIAALALTVRAEISFRGAWIATVANIDWPSVEAVGDKEKQQAEMVWILDSLASLGINAVIFQVRPTADALYYSKYEPTSHWLMGTQGDDKATLTLLYTLVGGVVQRRDPSLLPSQGEIAATGWQAVWKQVQKAVAKARQGGLK